MLYDDDIVLNITRREEVENKLEEWKRLWKTGDWRSVKRNLAVYLRFDQWRLELGWKLGYQSTGREFGNCIRNCFPLSAVLLDELWFVMFCQCYV